MSDTPCTTGMSLHPMTHDQNVLEGDTTRMLNAQNVIHKLNNKQQYIKY